MKNFSTYLVAAFAITMVTQSSEASALDVANLWVARFSTLKGDLRCAYGDPDCNRCVHDVEGQFRALTQGRGNIEAVNIWKWTDDHRYQPADRRVEDVLALNPENGHFQSIARAAAASPNLLTTHSGDSGLILSDGPERANGRLDNASVEALHSGRTSHPGGTQGIGQYFLIANEQDGTASLELMNASSPLEATRLYPLNDIGAASVAVAKVAGGGYVFATVTNSNDNGYRFWYTPSLEDVHIEEMWAGSVSSQGQPDFHLGEGAAGTGQGNAHGFEGISFLTECGSGDLYMVGVQGNAGFADNSGVWTLHKIAMNGAPDVAYRTRNTNDMHFPGCNTRAGGSAFAGKWGELGLYCGQKGKDEADRIYAITCGASVTYIVASLLQIVPGALQPVAAFLGLTSCTKMALDDNEAAYTEYWPGGGSVETPAEYVAQNVELDVTIEHAFGPLSSELVLAVDETPSDPTDSGKLMSCAHSEASGTKTCQFYVKRGSKVRVLAHTDGVWYWQDSFCSANGVRVDDDTTTCDVFVGTTSPAPLVFHAYNVI